MEQPTRGRRTWLERLPHWTEGLASIGASPDDTEDERLQKASLVLTVLAIVVLAVVWVWTYAALGLYVSAAIPFGYQLVSIASLVLLARTKRFEVFRTVHLTLILALPLFLQLSLGGFAASSGVSLWSLISPLSALVFSPRPLRWFWA